MTPQQLKAKVEEALWEEDALDARHIKVTVIGRDVWLDGDVSTPAMYDLADRIVEQTGGVGDFTNNLATTQQLYDIRSHRDGEDLRADPSTDITPGGRLETRIGPFGEEWDEAPPLEGETSGGSVGGDSGNPIHPMDLCEEAPMAGDILHAETPWRYQSDGANAHLDREPVLPPDEDEV